MSSITIEAAKTPAFHSIMGSMMVSGETLLDIPDQAINIGGHGRGFIIRETLDFDPSTTQDGTLDTLELGDDVYIFAVAHSSGVAQLVATKNITGPTGVDPLNSRRIGGFHFGRWRPLSERYNKSFEPPTIIVPTSVWDLNNRPRSEPTGMVKTPGGRFWADIYMASEDGGAWPNTIPLSRFGATPLSGIEGYARLLDLPLLAANAGKRLPTVPEFFIYADGAPEGNAANNDTAWSATSNSGRTATGTVAKAVSTCGVVDAAGLLWEPTLDHYDQSGTWAWNRSRTTTGKDGSQLRGEVYDVRWRFWLAGGLWGDGSQCGSRTAYSNAAPEIVGADVGLRCVSDSLNA
jgi:hypothetical protein